MAIRNASTLVLCVLVGLGLAACKAERLTGPDETNLAGCPVPEGITFEAAEKITCDKASFEATAELPVAAPTAVEPAPSVTQDAEGVTK